jgi:hypothetical protein
MASAPQVYPQPPPNFPHHGHSASMNNSFSQPPLGSFEAQSVASTPAQTPPPPRPVSQHQLNYGMNGTNGMMPPSNYGGYPDPNSGYAPAQPQHHPTPQTQPDFFPGGAKPQIYTVRCGKKFPCIPLTSPGRLFKCVCLRNGSKRSGCNAATT